jgi:hypothetical protein
VSLKKIRKKKKNIHVVGRFFLLSPDDFFRCLCFMLGPSFGPWCLSATSVHVGASLLVDSRGFFTRFCPRFADFAFVGLPLYIDTRGLFTRFCPHFADFVFVSLPLYIDSHGFFTRFCPRFTDFVFVVLPLYIDSRGLFT